MVYCAPVQLPPEAARARAPELERYTDQIMRAMAQEMPEEYRGVYAERAAENGR
jgi:hypothetical protein